MRGTILGVHDGRGILIGPNEQRLEFPLSEWRSAGTPMPGQIVDYVEAEGHAQGVFVVPGSSAGAIPATHSTSVTLGAIASGCLALGFIIPFVPTIAAFVLGVIGAGRARIEHDETGLLLSRIGWIGATVMLSLGALLILALAIFFGSFAGMAAWHGY